MGIVFLVPPAVEVTIRIFQLSEKCFASADTILVRPPQDSEPIDRDGAKPASEGAAAQVVVKVGKLSQERAEHFLDEVVDIR
jgi:hypothetical protein